MRCVFVPVDVDCSRWPGPWRSIKELPQQLQPGRKWQEALACLGLDRVVDRHADLAPPTPLDCISAEQLVKVCIGRCVRGLPSYAKERG